MRVALPPSVEMAQALPARRATIGLQVQAIAAHDTHARLPELAPATLVIHGTEDRVLGVRQRPADRLADPSPARALDGVGHMFWWEQPERSAELIRDHALAFA